MQILSEVLLTFGRELKRTLRSGKGLGGLLLFLVGGAGVAIVLFSFLERAEFYTARPETRTMMRRQVLSAMYDGVSGKDQIVDYLVSAPEPIMAFYPLTAFFLGIITMVWGFDTIAGDVQYRTIRYVTLRARRPSLVIGRWLALWVSGVIVSLVVSLILWAGLASKGPYDTSAVFHYGLRTWIATVTLSAWYSALTVLASSLFRTPVLALLTAGGSATVLWFLNKLSGAGWAPSWLKAAHDALPGAWDDRLIGPGIAQWGAGSGVCLLWSALALVAASAIVSKRDV
ncbi:MAG: ABC transporter permease subunit [Myxococcales bacterium]|nr:ABC transporter permease subunit [Myxococcales bacterium]